MSWDFKCLDWEKGKDGQDVQATLEGSAKATALSGNGCPGVFLRIPDGCSFVPDEEFCNVIRYFLTNYDLIGPDDPRIKLVDEIKLMKEVPGWDGGESKRIELPPRTQKEDS
ncbi:MAG: hypothetical protein V3W37_02380 [Candidatus Binatia bacterium]